MDVKHALVIQVHSGNKGRRICCSLHISYILSIGLLAHKKLPVKNMDVRISKRFHNESINKARALNQVIQII